MATNAGTIRLTTPRHSYPRPRLRAVARLALPVIWTEARRRNASVPQLIEWIAARPAKLIGLEHRKGAIAPGLDADFVVFDADAMFEPHASKLVSESEAKLSPYVYKETRKTLRGAVISTYLRGHRVFHRGELAPLGRSGAPPGEVLTRPGI